MHRLSSARNLYQSSFHGVSLPYHNSLKNTSITEIKCSFCRRMLLGHFGAGNFSAVFYLYFYSRYAEEKRISPDFNMSLGY